MHISPSVLNIIVNWNRDRTMVILNRILSIGHCWERSVKVEVTKTSFLSGRCSALWLEAWDSGELQAKPVTSVQLQNLLESKQHGLEAPGCSWHWDKTGKQGGVQQTNHSYSGLAVPSWVSHFLLLSQRLHQDHSAFWYLVSVFGFLVKQ